MRFIEREETIVRILEEKYGKGFFYDHGGDIYEKSDTTESCNA